MLPVPCCPPGLRLLRRRAVQQPVFITPIPSVRPSLLSRRLCGDLWVEADGCETAAVLHEDQALARISASALDLPSMNVLLDRARNRRPRR
jgi:hypothetical protein